MTTPESSLRRPAASTSPSWLSSAGPALLGLAGALAAGALVRRLSRPMTFKDQVVLITGGSRGLGLALARRFAGEGARLALLARSADQLATAAAALRRDCEAEVLTVVCDVRDAQAVNAAVATVAGHYGAIDVLVNNAGIIQVMPFAHAQLEDFRDSLDTHFWGPLYLTQACLPHLRASAGRRVINIASIGGRIAVPHLLPYVVGKFALVGLSEGLHAELRRDGVHVTTATPHLMQTGSHRNVLVRGRHEREATWFALGTATRLTALGADRAARQIIEASRRRRAHVTPGWQARIAEISQVVAPELVASLTALAAGAVLPAEEPSGGDAPRYSRDLDVGPVARFFATDAARDLNQRVAGDEAAAQTT